MPYCEIEYTHEGKVKTWPIDAHPTRDNAQTLQAHLDKYLIGAVLISYTFYGSIVSGTISKAEANRREEH